MLTTVFQNGLPELFYQKVRFYIPFLRYTGENFKNSSILQPLAPSLELNRGHGVSNYICTKHALENMCANFQYFVLYVRKFPILCTICVQISFLNTEKFIRKENQPEAT
jgi:hypothetical protein